jgi:hypothetical protein
MNAHRRGERSVLGALTAFVAFGLNTAYAGAPRVVPSGAVAPRIDSLLAQPRPSRALLDLRVPSLQRVMSRRQLEEEPTADEAEAIKVLAAPDLVPMSSDSEAPLGIAGSLQWAVAHPTQSWRLVFPSVVAP